MAKDLEVPDKGGELEEIKGALEQAHALAGLKEIGYDDPQATQLAIAARILTAGSEDEAFREIPTVSSKAAIGRTFEVRDVRLFRSQYGENGKGAFVACDAVDVESGELIILNTGAVTVAAKLLWLKNHDGLPRQVQIVEKTRTADGNQVLDLKPL